MDDYEENIQLTKKDLEKIKKILKQSKFSDFKIHKHYWLNGIKGIPRHGFEIINLKEIFNKTELIKIGFKRKSKIGFTYTLIYKKSTNFFIKICYFFDEKPMKIFNAIPIHRNLEKVLLRRYGVRV